MRAQTLVSPGGRESHPIKAEAGSPAPMDRIESGMSGVPGAD
jgi:hypothetical protein